MGMRMSDRMAQFGGAMADYGDRFFEADRLRAELEKARQMEEARKTAVNQTLPMLSQMQYYREPATRQDILGAISPVAQHVSQYGDTKAMQGISPMVNLLMGDIEAAERYKEKQLGAEVAKDKYSQSQTEKDKKFDVEQSKYRNEFVNRWKDKIPTTPAVKQVQETKSAYDEIKGLLEESSKSGSGAFDYAAIFKFLKVLDPPSTVREGEFKMAENTSGPLKKIGKIIDKMNSGKLLNEEERQAFMNAARLTYRSRLEGLKQVESDYEGRVQSFNQFIDPKYKVDINEILDPSYRYEKLVSDAEKESKQYEEKVRRKALEVANDPKKFSQHFEEGDVAKFKKEYGQMLGAHKTALEARLKRPLKDDETAQILRRLMVEDRLKSTGKLEKEDTGLLGLGIMGL